jgi:hypothetical protein
MVALFYEIGIINHQTLQFKCTIAYPAIISKKLNVYLECLSKEVMQNYNLTSQGAETLGRQTTGD